MKNKISLVLCALFLTSCQFSDEGISENEKRIEALKKRPAGRIAPLPEFSNNKTDFIPIKFSANQFIDPLTQSTEFKTCTPITSENVIFSLTNTNINAIYFLQTKVSQDKGEVTVWANEEIVQIAQGSIISQQYWQIETVAPESIVLAQIDLKCGYTTKTQKLLIENRYDEKKSSD